MAKKKKKQNPDTSINVLIDNEKSLKNSVKLNNENEFQLAHSLSNNFLKVPPNKLKKKKLRKIFEKITNNAVIYIRVSTEEQAKKGYSLAGQEEDCRKFAILEGLNVIKIFREEGESAKSTKRTEFQKMLKFCKENKKDIKAVIFWKMERFMRYLKDQINVIDDLNSIGIEVLSVTEPNGNGAAGNLTRNILGALAQYDNELKSERVTNGMKQAFKSGRWLWRAPYGYEQCTAIGNIRPKDKTKDIVKNLFEKFATACYSQADLISDLKKQGIKMNATHLCKILHNPIYCGWMYKEEWCSEYVKGTYKAIISEKTFSTVQDILNGRKPVIAPHDFENPDYPLKQFLICPYCGKPLTGSTSTGRNKKKFYYYACYNKKCTGKFSMSKNEIEKGFIKLLQNIQPKEEVVTVFKDIVKDVYNEQVCEQKALNSTMQKNLNNLSENKKRLVDFYLNGKIDEDTYELKLSDIVEQEQAIKTNMQNKILPKNDIEKCLNSSLSVIQNLSNAWNDSVLRIKKNIQNLIFPNGLSADFSTFQNSLNPIIFKQIGTLSVPSYNMVPPSEFESLSTP